MTIKDILNMSYDMVGRLNERQLRKYVQILASAGNKRLKTFRNKGISSPATRHIEKKGNFSTKGKNINQLRNEFSRAKRFLESETGTIKGYNQTIDKTIDSLASKGVYMNREQVEETFKAFEMLKETNPEVSNKLMKYRILEEIQSQALDGMTADEIVDSVRENLDYIYENIQEEINAKSVFEL